MKKSQNFPLITKDENFGNFRKPEKIFFFFNSLMTALYSYAPKIDSRVILAKIKTPKLKSEKKIFQIFEKKFFPKKNFFVPPKIFFQNSKFIRILFLTPIKSNSASSPPHISPNNSTYTHKNQNFWSKNGHFWKKKNFG